MNAGRLRGAVSLLALVFLAVPAVVGCGGEELMAAGGESAGAGQPGMDTGTKGETVAALTDDALALAKGSVQFALDMYGRLAGGGNLFFSPYSISTALGMTAAGARGVTEQEMVEALHLSLSGGGPDAGGAAGGSRTAEDGAGEAPVGAGAAIDDAARERIAAAFSALQRTYAASSEDDGYELNVANALWGQEGYPFRKDYLEFVERHFGGGFNLADFNGKPDSERVRINRWVEKETRERIRDLIPEGGIDKMTTLVLTNAVYFKGRWALRFDEELTRDATFHGDGGDATVPMMYRKGDFGYYEDEAVQVLEMPYRGGNVSMLAVLPKEGVTTLAAVEASLTPGMLSEWAGALRKKEVKVYFPKFEMTWGTRDISRDLAALGIKEAFSAKADFSGMTDLRDLFIGPVFHKAFVSVDEEGTEAAAATAVVMKRLAVERETVFRADRPFMFMIRDDRTGGILFMGRVANLE